MNWLDIILIIIIGLCFIGGIVLLVLSIVDDEIGAGFLIMFGMWGIGFLFSIPFIVLDKASGSTIGIITSVDKNFFGTTALYIKTTETKEEKYCIEFNDKLESIAKELIGKKVKISYGKRVGLYSTGKCSQAPVETIEVIKGE